MNFTSGEYKHHPMVDYFNAMDPAVYSEGAPGAVKDEMKIGINEIGMSVPMGISAGNVSGIYSKIRMGAGALEIQFPGAFHGQRQAQTPDMYGQDQRQAIRELGIINEIKFTTHASMNIMGMMGQDQQGNFSMARAKMGEDEVRRAIEFASDTAGGGSVVVHTGEFERPLTHIYPEGYIMDQNGNLIPNESRDPETGRLLFKKKITEPKEYQFQLLDERTGQVQIAVQGDRLVAQPIWKRSKEDKPYIDRNGKVVHKNDFVDYEGALVEDPYDIKFLMNITEKPAGGRVPEYDRETGRFQTRMMHLNDFEREALEWNREFKKVTGRDPDAWERMSGRESFLKAQLYTQAAHSRGWALQYGQATDKEIEAIEKLRKAKEFYEKLDKNLPEDEKWKILQQEPQISRFIVPGSKNPLELIDKEIRDHEKHLEFAKQASTSQELQAADTIENIRHLKTPEKFMERYSMRSYAQLGIKAIEESKDPNNPVVVCMENIFPEKYGGHPAELKHLILSARKKMVEMMTSPKMELTGDEGEWFKKESEKYGEYYQRQIMEGKNPFYRPGVTREEAERLAQSHIKGTLDTGHLNLWRKYYQEDPSKSKEENDASFKRWYLSQVEDLAKNKLIGNVHLADNYGYYDDHLAPGQGNAPVKEAVAILRKHGYDKALTVEPGADASTDLSDFHGLMKTWRHFGSQVYGIGGGMGGPSQSWGDVQYSYFGQNKPPYFVFGSYSPSNEWTLWSTMPME